MGDIHGSLTCLHHLMRRLDFDKTRDRMFSVGDLVDRGPDSLATLELLHEPWFHCVLANHEQMMLEAFAGGFMGQFWLPNGGVWGIEALNDWKTRKLDKSRVPLDDSVRLFDLLPLVRELPYLMTVNMPDGGKFHLIHAEFPPYCTITDEVLADDNGVLQLATHDASDGTHIIWGRHLFYQFYNTDLSNVAKVNRTVANNFPRGDHFFNDKLSHIISGHTPVQRPLTIFGQTNIDTCAYGSYSRQAASWQALTCIELGTWKFYQATETEFRAVEPLVINRSTIERI